MLRWGLLPCWRRCRLLLSRERYLVKERQCLSADFLRHFIVLAGLRQRIDGHNDLTGITVLLVTNKEPLILNGQRQHCAVTGLLALAGDCAVTLNLYVRGSKGAQPHLHLGFIAAQLS